MRDKEPQLAEETEQTQFEQEQQDHGEFEDEQSQATSPPEDSEEFQQESSDDESDNGDQQQPQLSATEIEKLKSDNNRMRREIAEAAKRDKRRKAEQKKEEEKRQQEQGEWQSLAEQRERERDEALQRLTQQERTSRISRVASRVGFNDPGDAPRFLSEDDVDLDDDTDVERALSALGEQKPYLLEQRQPQRKAQAAGPSNPPKPRLTREQVEKLTPEEQQRLMETGELQEWMRANGKR